MPNPMSFSVRALGSFLLIATGSCAAYGERVTTQSAQETCAKKGGTFKKESFGETKSTWVLAGTCVIPDETAAAAAPTGAVAPK